ncbi:MAG: HAMP domain-containing protein, partial [Terriglobia bacterium]
MKNLLDNLLSPVSRLLPRRIRLFYVILIVLLLLSVVPLAIFRWWVGSSTRERVETIQRHRQTTVTRGIAADISGDLRSAERQIESLERMLELRGAIYDVAAPQHAGTIDGAIESFVGPAENLLFVTVVNPRQRGRQGGVPEIGQDDFVQQRLRDGFQRAQLNQGFNSGAFLVHAGSEDVPVMVMARPLAVGNDFRGMVATVVSLQFLRERLQESSEGGLDIYVVDRNGRLIIHSNERDFHVGQDMTSIRIVQRFLEGTARATLNTEFDLTENGRTVRMLGSQSPVRGLDWAVIAQDEIDNAYAAVRELETLAISLLVVAMLLSVGIGYYSARRLTTPIEILAQTTRAIAKGDFSRRVNLPGRTEIGELADTFNVMTDDLEKYVEQLKQAAQENHELFLGSIRTLAAAIDEKDPYTRGHSGRVSKYSVILAEHMALEDEEVYKIRISALLHDVGKIGIDDRILKKPA